MSTLQDIFESILRRNDIGTDFIVDWISINYLFSKTDKTMGDLWRNNPDSYKFDMKIILDNNEAEKNSVTIKMDEEWKIRAIDMGLKISNAINNHAIFEKLLNNLNKIYKYYPQKRTNFGNLFGKIKSIFPAKTISEGLTDLIEDLPPKIQNNILKDNAYLYTEIESLQHFRNYYIHNSDYDLRMYNIVNFDKSKYNLAFIESIPTKNFCIYLCGLYIIMNLK